MGEDLQSQILQWVERSGRALELRVAREVRRAGGLPEQSFTYTDFNTKATREGDVRATFTWTGQENVPCRLRAVIECKSSRDRPWVGFVDEIRTSVQTLESWTLAAHGPFDALIKPLRELWIGDPPFDDPHICTHVVAALAKETSGESGLNSAHNAIQQVLSAAVAEWEAYKQHQRREGPALVLVAAVVTGAPLFTAVLGTDDTVQLKPVEQFAVRVDRPTGGYARVWVFNEGALPPFLAGLAESARKADLHASFT